MGNCGMSTSITQVTVTHTRASQESLLQRRRIQRPLEENKEPFEFADFEEYKNGKMINEGLKQIPSYICMIPFDKLSELREKFWESKCQSSRHWKAIRQICESCPETAIQLLNEAGMACQDNLRLIIDLETSKTYKVPNFCVSDPIFERDYEVIDQALENTEEKQIVIICYCSLSNKETILHISNRLYGKDIKELFAEKEEYSLDQYKIRLFYSGQEIVDNRMLYYYNINDQSKLQVMCSKIEID